MNRLRFALIVVGSCIVGGTFVAAGLLKSLDVDGFARDIGLHGILGPGASWWLARVLVPFEIVVGAGVILGYRRRLGLALLIGALATFIGATGYAWSQGKTEGCGCFGRYAARTPGAVILEDLILIAAGTLAFVLAAGGTGAGEGEPDPRSSGGWRGPFLAAAALGAVAFTLASPSLPIDNFATALRPGVTLADLGLDRIAGDLAQGDRLLVVLVLDEGASRQAVAPLNRLGEAAGVPSITGLTSATEEERAAFFWDLAPGFQLLEAPASDLRRLYRRAPRSFRVHNGAVLQVWDGIPRVEDLAL